MVLRRRVRARPGRKLLGDGTLRRQALVAFGHTLTAAQEAVLAEIDEDLETFMKSWRESHAYNPRAGMKE